MIQHDRGSFVVTGSSSGIGLAIARHFLADGHRIVGISRSAGPLAEAAGFTHIPADLSSSSELAAAAAMARAAGPVEGIVHAAGLQFSGRLGQLDHDGSERMWRVHALAAEELVNALAPTMQDHGRIILIGSRIASGVAGKSQYGATKAALVAMGRAWAAELAPRGITVNVVAPGPTDTPMLQDPNRAATPVVSPPLERLVRPGEVASLVGFLAGPTGAMITGQHVAICGGVSLS